MKKQKIVRNLAVTIQMTSQTFQALIWSASKKAAKTFVLLESEIMVTYFNV